MVRRKKWIWEDVNPEKVKEWVPYLVGAAIIVVFIIVIFIMN